MTWIDEHTHISCTVDCKIAENKWVRIGEVNSALLDLLFRWNSDFNACVNPWTEIYSLILSAGTKKKAIYITIESKWGLNSSNILVSSSYCQVRYNLEESDPVAIPLDCHRYPQLSPRYPVRFSCFFLAWNISNLGLPWKNTCL